MPRRTSLIPLLTAGAAIVAVVGVLCAAVLLLTSATVNAGVIAQAVLMVTVTAALALALYGLAGALRHEQVDATSDTTRALVRVQTQLGELTAKVMQLDEASERIARAQENMITAPPPLSLTSADLEPIFESLRELRELTMLPDADRTERLQRYRAEKKASSVKRAFDLVAARQWHDAERLVLSLETDFPNDSEVQKARHYLNHARKLNEDETITRTIRQVEELMSAAAWDQALAQARALVEGFPDNGEARALFTRVQRERDIYYESSVARMFDELRQDIDRRLWRRALAHAHELLQKFPTHPRADGVRRQLKTIQDNAEIEERQELEVRIQELIRAQRFDDAIHLGEDLIRRYPMSPQAESLDLLLPRLRDLAREGSGAERSEATGEPREDENIPSTHPAG